MLCIQFYRNHYRRNAYLARTTNSNLIKMGFAVANQSCWLVSRASNQDLHVWIEYLPSCLSLKNITIKDVMLHICSCKRFQYLNIIRNQHQWFKYKIKPIPFLTKFWGPYFSTGSFSRWLWNLFFILPSELPSTTLSITSSERAYPK